MNNKEMIVDSIENMPFGALIYNLSKNQIKFFNKKVKKYNLNAMQVLFLIKLNYFKDLSQNDLAIMFNLSKGFVAKSLKKLEDNGYITRRDDLEDSRRNIIELTNKALELIPYISTINDEWEKELGLDDERLKDEIKELTLKSFETI
jgi:DNA-binding MarR family transcriptional regulator